MEQRNQEQIFKQQLQEIVIQLVGQLTSQMAQSHRVEDLRSALPDLSQEELDERLHELEKVEIEQLDKLLQIGKILQQLFD